MNQRTDLFLDKYRQLEAMISAKFNLRDSDSPVAYLERRAEYREIKSDLSYCRDVRNLLSHNPKINGSYAVEPSEEMLALLDQTMERVANPLRAKNIWVPREKVVCRTMKDPVRPAMVEMRAHNYTHIPILKAGVVIGVFSENTLLNYLLDQRAVPIDDGVPFSDLEQYLALNQHRSESFRFIGKETPVSDIEDIFAAADRNSDRIGLIFVTRSGKSTEKLLGIISPWDMAGID